MCAATPECVSAYPADHEFMDSNRLQYSYHENDHTSDIAKCKSQIPSLPTAIERSQYVLPFRRTQMLISGNDIHNPVHLTLLPRVCAPALQEAGNYQRWMIEAQEKEADRAALATQTAIEKDLAHNKELERVQKERDAAVALSCEAQAQHAAAKTALCEAKCGFKRDISHLEQVVEQVNFRLGLAQDVARADRSMTYMLSERNQVGPAAHLHSYSQSGSSETVSSCTYCELGTRLYLLTVYQFEINLFEPTDGLSQDFPTNRNIARRMIYDRFQSFPVRFHTRFGGDFLLNGRKFESHDRS